MTLDKLIVSAAAALGHADFQYVQGKTCDFLLPSGLHLVVEPSPAEEAVHLYAVIGSMPAEPGRFAESLLQAQLFHREMGEGCCFGLDEGSGEIFLNRKLTTSNLEVEGFLAVLNEFANWTSYWHEKLQSPVAAVESGSALDDLQFLRA